MFQYVFTCLNVLGLVNVSCRLPHSFYLLELFFNPPIQNLAKCTWNLKLGIILVIRKNAKKENVTVRFLRWFFLLKE